MRIARFFALGKDLERLKELDYGADWTDLPLLELAEDDLINQLRSVLRLGKGQKFLIIDDNERIYEMRIEGLEKAKVHCKIESIVDKEESASGKCRVEIGLALIKSDRFEWCLEKLSELGAAAVSPLLCRHCVVKANKDAKGEEKQERKLQRWQAIMREAAEQCERLTIPAIVPPRNLADYLQDRKALSDALRFICAERREAAPLVKALESEISKRDPSPIKQRAPVFLLIGPEGGFSKDEIELAEDQGFLPVTLGRRILRSETAAIVAMSQVASILDI
ncbi:MAG: 16S rRNA (uracil(1498)-N(3))-methyltransferase [Candidatus Obscuribacterales bacterium]|nr:16S rRNA (uracil(1498)-N(3))-methyltransferase [Candidatus Obscuribacterales bacterium]